MTAIRLSAPSGESREALAGMWMVYEAPDMVPVTRVFPSSPTVIGVSSSLVFPIAQKSWTGTPWERSAPSIE